MGWPALSPPPPPPPPALALIPPGRDTPLAGEATPLAGALTSPPLTPEVAISTCRFWTYGAFDAGTIFAVTIEVAAAVTTASLIPRTGNA